MGGKNWQRPEEFATSHRHLKGLHDRIGSEEVAEFEQAPAQLSR